MLESRSRTGKGLATITNPTAIQTVRKGVADYLNTKGHSFFRSKDGLEDVDNLVRYVRDLPESDVRLRALSVLPESWIMEDAGYLDGEETRLIAESLFHRRTHSASLEGLTQALLKDYATSLATIAPEDVTEHVAGLARLTAHQDRVVALTAIGLLYSWLADWEETLVINSRKYDELSWAELGLLLNRSKQAVWERYHAETEG